MKFKLVLFLSIFLFGFTFPSNDYPIDGYKKTQIKRLKYLNLIQEGELKGKNILPGAMKSICDIKLNLMEDRYHDMEKMPTPDPDLQKKLNSLFPNLHSSYSVTLMDITPGREARFAERKSDRQFQPGSVGKLAVAVAFFSELKKQYPDSFEKRTNLMKTRVVKAGRWGVYDHHTVPMFDTTENKLIKRRVTTADTATLYEWVDHMLSVSNNGAASIVWREAILMRAFCGEYPFLTQERADQYFEDKERSYLMDLAIEVVNEPLRELGIGENEWRLGTMFTRGATGIIPGKGGSTGSPYGLMKFLVALERGAVVDYESSLELKRLMYMTDRRIRYAGNKSLNEAAVYYKSGSLYSCDKSKGPCGKYKGNRYNYMNSVIIVEHPDGTTYMVALMTNVLGRNSNWDHRSLAGKIDKIVREI